MPGPAEPSRFERLQARLDERYGLLLLLLTVSFVVTAIDGSAPVRLIAAIINIGSLLVAMAVTGLNPRSPRVAVVTVLGLIGVPLVASPSVGDLGTSLGAGAQAVMLTMITAAVLQRVSSAARVTLQTILGALAGYFLIGQVFAWVYLALPGIAGQPILDPATDGEVPVYYSYVVLTTLGFGDVTPAGALAERITILEALTGQVFLAVLIARLVSVYGRER